MNWRASATTTHRVHSKLIATASLRGTTRSGEPETSTTWNAIAVARQSVQRAPACASLKLSTTSPPRWVRHLEREVERATAVLFDDGGRGVVLVPLRGVGLRRGREDAGQRQQRHLGGAAQSGGTHEPPPVGGAVSPCSIVDVWVVVALATPWSVWTITESWSATA